MRYRVMLLGFAVPALLFAQSFDSRPVAFGYRALAQGSVGMGNVLGLPR